MLILPVVLRSRKGKTLLAGGYIIPIDKAIDFLDIIRRSVGTGSDDRTLRAVAVPTRLERWLKEKHRFTTKVLFTDDPVTKDIAILVTLHARWLEDSNFKYVETEKDRNFKTKLMSIAGEGWGMAADDIRFDTIDADAFEAAGR